MNLTLDDMRTLYRLLHNQQEELITLSQRLLMAEAEVQRLKHHQPLPSEAVAQANGYGEKEEYGGSA